jgi:hypothetical protein
MFDVWPPVAARSLLLFEGPVGQLSDSNAASVPAFAKPVRY